MSDTRPPQSSPATHGLASPDGRDDRDSWRRLTVPSLALAGGLSALEVLRGWIQNRNVFSPSAFPADWTPPPRMPLEEVELVSDGATLFGWWASRREADGAVVFCHGSTGNVTDRLDIVRVLRRLKLNVLIFDYRGYGRSTGTPSEKGLYRDVRAALDHVHEERGIPWERILLFGHSLGGAVAIDAATDRPVGGLVVQSSFTDLRDMVKYSHPGTPLPWITRNQFRSIEKIGALEMPKLIVHGEADERVPIEQGERLFAAATADKTWHSVPGAGHHDVHRLRPVRYFLALRRFRRRVLGS